MCGVVPADGADGMVLTGDAVFGRAEVLEGAIGVLVALPASIAWSINAALVAYQPCQAISS